MLKQRALVGTKLDQRQITIETGLLHRLKNALDFPIVPTEDEKALEAFPPYFLCSLIDYHAIYPKLGLALHRLLLSRESILAHEQIYPGDVLDITTVLKDIYEQQASGNPIGFIILESMGQKLGQIAFLTERVLAVRGAFPGGSLKIYWDDLEIGTLVPQIKKEPISRVQIARFASATDDFHPLHVDEEAAKNAGFGGVFAHGLFSMALINDAIFHYAQNARLIALSSTFQRLVWPKDALKAEGMVIRRYTEHKEYRIELDLWAKNQKDEVIAKASAILLVFKNPQSEKNSKSRIPCLSKESIQEINETYQKTFCEAPNSTHFKSITPTQAPKARVFDPL